MQKCIISNTHVEEITTIFVNRSFMFVVFFFSIMFSFISDFQANPLDYTANKKEPVDSIKKEPAQLATDEVLDWEEVEGKPEILKSAEPYYPEHARKEGISGIVLVTVLIDTVGNVELAEISKSIKGLDQAALDAARKFKFTPGTKSDQPVKVKMQIPFKFYLK